MILSDAHCHLMHGLFKGKVGEVIERARKAGVKAIICSGVNVPTTREAMKLAEQYNIVKCSAGIYPVDAIGEGADESGLSRQKGKTDLEAEFEFIKKNKEKIVAIGEAGLDFYWIKNAEKQKQMKEIFGKVIEFAEKIKKPLIVHSRKAEKECIDMLETSNVKVMQHCFSGKKSQLKRAIDLGHYIGIPASITRVPQFQMNAEIAPMDQMLTETDAPWQSPVKEKVNEPAFVEHGVKKIAEIKGFEKEEIANQLWVNFQRVFS